jgi:hypothetical protein
MIPIAHPPHAKPTDRRPGRRTSRAARAMSERGLSTEAPLTCGPNTPFPQPTASAILYGGFFAVNRFTLCSRDGIAAPARCTSRYGTSR